MSNTDDARGYHSKFLWGVATSGFQIEGGFNAAGKPQNNWADWERRADVEETGAACDFWGRWEEDLERAKSLGVNAFRFGLEWARLEPTSQGGLDADALARYAQIIAGCRRRGMRPVVTLQHFTHPAWLGVDAWLDPGTPARFGAYVRALVTALTRALRAEHGQDAVDFYVTLNEPNVLAMATYALGVFPRRQRPSPWAFSASLAGMLLGHVEAYRAIHEAHAALAAVTPTVTMNTWACLEYAYDRGLIDLLRPGTRRDRRAARRRWQAAFPERAPSDQLYGAMLSRMLRPAAFDALLDALGVDEDPLDALSFDYYDPLLSGYLAPFHVRRHPWEWSTRPALLPRFVEAYLESHEDRPLYILENGIGTRPTPDGGRRDALRRDDALREALGALDETVAAGHDVRGYFHWSLIDNYEWGAFEPRFGLFGVDYEDGARRLTLDSTGVDAAGCYRALIAARRRQS